MYRILRKLAKRKVEVDAQAIDVPVDAEVDLCDWLSNGRVVVLDTRPADRWLADEEPFAQYFASAVERARREASDDVDEAMSHHTTPA